MTVEKGFLVLKGVFSRCFQCPTRSPPHSSPHLESCPLPAPATLSLRTFPLTLTQPLTHGAEGVGNTPSGEIARTHVLPSPGSRNEPQLPGGVCPDGTSPTPLPFLSDHLSPGSSLSFRYTTATHVSASGRVSGQPSLGQAVPKH